MAESSTSSLEALSLDDSLARSSTARDEPRGSPAASSSANGEASFPVLDFRSSKPDAALDPHYSPVGGASTRVGKRLLGKGALAALSASPASSSAPDTPEEEAHPRQVLDPWSENAWDHVEWTDEHERAALDRVATQRQTPVADERAKELNDPASAARNWDTFYRTQGEKFFQSRAWLLDEFAELRDAICRQEEHDDDGRDRLVVELGSGAGAGFLPLVRARTRPATKLVALDYAPKAIELLRASEVFTGAANVDADVWDLSNGAGELPACVPEGQADVVVCVFVLSALHPREWTCALRNISKMLRPGGALLLRDYGRHDMAQLRFKKDRWLQDNLYVRGDDTRVYFFTRDELIRIFGGAPSDRDGVEAGTSGEAQECAAACERETSSRLELVHVGVDRRLILNRARRIAMHRIWMQGRWRKPL